MLRVSGISRIYGRSALMATLFVCLLILVGCSGPDSFSVTDETPTVSDPTATAESNPTQPPPPANATPQDAHGEATEPPAQANTPEPEQTVVSEETPVPPVPSPASPDEPTPTEVPGTSFDPNAVDISYRQVGSGFQQPVFVTHGGDGSGRVYVLEKVGAVKLLDGTTILDIRNKVVQTGVFGYEHEQGMLGLAFHPRFSENGYFYVHYNDVQGNHIISRFTVLESGVADPGSEYVLMAYDQPEVNFQGGMLTFGRDGYLYIGTGTGGSAVELQFLAQDLDSIYGKMLRIDVDGGDPYGIPADNPFVGVEGARGEIWAYGLRNPWRFSFDRVTGDLFIGGPGQFTEEWIDFQPADKPAGQNFGWPMYEGTQCWESWDGPCDPEGLRMPILTYPTYQNGNCVVIGGYVHRGTDAPLLNGAYFFGDFCSGNVWVGWPDAAGEWQMMPAFQIEGLVSSFGEDEDGALYVSDINNGIIYQVIQSAR
jgi:glucose/arabinose dehydrogenase